MTARKLGAEFILGAIFIPVIVWIFASITNLDKAYATLKERSDLREETLKEIKEDVKFIRQKLEDK
jgi:hypothetical protein